MKMKMKTGYLIKEMAGERVVIMQGRAGVDMTKIISFNATSEWLWNMFAGKSFTEEEVAGVIVKQYGIDASTAALDAGSWVKQLSDANLLES
jgi:hypothetical protein